jgi:WD40 repeat protein
MVSGTDSLFDSFADGDDGWLVSKMNWPLVHDRYNVQWIDANTAVVSDSTNICVYDIFTGTIKSKTMAPLPLPKGGILSADCKSLYYFTPDAQMQYTVAKAVLKTCDLTELGKVKNTSGMVGITGLIPGGQYFYIIDSAVTIYDLQTLQPVSRVEFAVGAFKAAGFSHDGKTYAFADAPDPQSSDQIIRIHDVKTGKIEKAFSYKGPSLTTLDYSPDGKQLMGLDQEGNVKLWKLPN